MGLFVREGRLAVFIIVDAVHVGLVIRITKGVIANQFDDIIELFVDVLE
jgi:hypothetical protein